MKKKILITGSSGYIGQHLVKMLKDQYILTGLDRVEHNNLDNLLQDVTNLTTPLETEYDVVVHLAALVQVGESVLFPTDYYLTNTVGTLNILKNVKCKNFVLASTGAANQLTCPYGISKKAAEEIVAEYCQKNKIDYTIFRFYNVVGTDGIVPTNPDGLFYALIKAMQTNEFTIYGDDYKTADGTCVRDYVHVNEICNAIKLAIETPSNKIENLGHGKGYSVKEIAELFKTVNNANITINIGPRREGDIEVSILDNVSKYMQSLYTIEELLDIRYNY